MPSKGQVTANRSMPPGILIPELVYPDRRAAVAWLCAALGFVERLRIGDHRSQLVLGETSAIVVIQATGQVQRPSAATHSLMVRVDDVDRHYAHVMQHGAQVVSPPADFPYGERQYTVEDLGGHRWTFSQSFADVDPQEWGGLLLQ
jgi:uncharacterized glyoxalase superfamily protein PhnB